MATTIQTSIQIQATPERVWEILTDFAAYPEWNPFVCSLTGDVKTGNRIRVQLTPPGQKGMVFQPRVIAYDPNQKLEWLGNLFFRGIFDGAHRFELIANEDGTTTFIHSERFKGILVPFMKKMLNGPTMEGFKAMNEALKHRTETF
jgi:hypothetical protein